MTQFKRQNIYYKAEKKVIRRKGFHLSNESILLGYRMKVLYKSSDGRRLFLFGKLVPMSEVTKAVKEIDMRKPHKKKALGFIPTKYTTKTPEFIAFMQNQNKNVFKQYIEVSA